MTICLCTQWFYIFLEAAADLLPWVECIDHCFLKIVTVAGLFCCHEVLSTARYSHEICWLYKEVTGGTWGEQPKLELVSCVFPQRVNSQTHYYSPLLNSCEWLTNKSWDVSNTLLLLSQPAHVRTSILQCVNIRRIPEFFLQLTIPGGNSSPFPELAEERGEDLRLHIELEKNCLSLPSLLLSVSYNTEERELERGIIIACTAMFVKPLSPMEMCMH